MGGGGGGGESKSMRAPLPKPVCVMMKIVYIYGIQLRCLLSGGGLLRDVRIFSSLIALLVFPQLKTKFPEMNSEIS